MQDDIVTFLRKKDYRLLAELGQGACGKTVLLLDDYLDEKFACKKYCPYFSDLKESLFKKFVQEIKLLHSLCHPNIVRIFNYYLYPDSYTGYILMEYIEGDSIGSFLQMYPQKVNDIFSQTINGFKYLEANGILHRDIRPLNIMVNNEGVLKIIDFGFGKKISTEEDFDKSISLNWWCQLPHEFKEKKYTFASEVYFIGKLFEKFIEESGIENFEYPDLLDAMCAVSPESRISSFEDVSRKMLKEQISSVEFDELEKSVYRDFVAQLSTCISRIERGAKYISDFAFIENRLENIYKTTMLEQYMPSRAVDMVIGSFLEGEYSYNRKSFFETNSLIEFLKVFRNCNQKKKLIVISNLQTRLDSLEKYDSDAIPF